MIGVDGRDEGVRERVGRGTEEEGEREKHRKKEGKNVHEWKGVREYRHPM